MVIGADPVVASAGPLAVRWYGILALAGLGLGVWLAAREARAREVPADRLWNAAVWAIPAGIVAAHLAHVLGSWEGYVTQPSAILGFSLEELSLWGGLVGGGLVAARTLRRDPLTRARLADAVAPGLALGIAVGRIGSFLDGAGQGLPTSLPWGTQYASRLAFVPDFGVPRHPAQVYDGLVALAAFGVVSLVPRGAPAGARLWVFLAIYGGARVALGTVRLESPFLLGLQLDQLLAGAAALYALFQLLSVARRDRSRPLVEGASV